MKKYLKETSSGTKVLVEELEIGDRVEAWWFDSYPNKRSFAGFGTIKSATWFTEETSQSCLVLWETPTKDCITHVIEKQHKFGSGYLYYHPRPVQLLI